MIDIALHTNETTTVFTLSSLLDKSENFRLHLITRPPVWETMQPVHQWALNNFREVYIYQSPWSIKGQLIRFGSGRNAAQIQARMILLLKEYWKDRPMKGGPIERMIVCDHQPRIFSQSTLAEGQLPTVAQMGTKIAYVPKAYDYLNHPQFKNYYSILGLKVQEKDHDKSIMLLNWKEVEKLDSRNWLPMGRATRHTIPPEVTPLVNWNKRQISKTAGRWHNEKDSFVLSANNRTMMMNFSQVGLGFAPTYFNGKLDTLIDLEAIGAKDCINANIRLRKSYSLTMDWQRWVTPYWNMPTLPYIAMPWDMWTKYIDNIPFNLRPGAVCEQLLDKAERQKGFIKSITEAGYLVGKI